MIARRERAGSEQGLKWNLLCKCHDSARCVQHPFAIFPSCQPVGAEGQIRSQKRPPMTQLELVYVGADCSAWKWPWSCGAKLCFLPFKSQHTYAPLSQTKVNKAASPERNKVRVVLFLRSYSSTFGLNLNFIYLCAYIFGLLNFMNYWLTFIYTKRLPVERLTQILE